MVAWSCKYGREKKRKNRVVWLSCAWLRKREPMLFFHRSTIPMAISVKKDCWDLEILLPWSHDVTLLLSINQSGQAKSIIWANQNLKKIQVSGLRSGKKRAYTLWLLSYFWLVKKRHVTARETIESGKAVPLTFQGQLETADRLGLPSPPKLALLLASCTR